MVAPQHWRTHVQAVQESAAEALQTVDRARVAAVAVSGQQHGLVALDGRGDVIRPAKLWCDVEAAPQATRLSAAFDRAVPPGFTAPKLLWMQDEEPDAFERIETVLLPHDYVNYWLTGNFAMEVRNRRWNCLHAFEVSLSARLGRRERCLCTPQASCLRMVLRHYDVVQPDECIP